MMGLRDEQDAEKRVFSGIQAKVAREAFKEEAPIIFRAIYGRL